MQTGREVDEKIEEFVIKLREKGHRITAQRVAIARLVLENIKTHPSFTDILGRAKATIPGVSASTIYNTLQLLEEMGFVQSFSVKGATVYDSPHPHVNIVCTDTGQVYDLEENSQKLLEEASAKTGKKIRNIVVYALCQQQAN